MDGFVRSDSGPVAMGYWTKDDLPFYHGLASTFPVCDRWFGSCMGQTFPNRRFLLAGTAGDPAILRLLPAFILKEEHIDRLRAALVDL